VRTVRAFYTLLGLAMMIPAVAKAAPQSWRVSERSGPVTILHSGINKVAVQGAEAAAGDVVATGANGRAVLVRGEDYLVVAPSSRLRIATPSQKNSLLQVLQDSGNVVYKIKHLLTPHFSVETPYLAAVVKGTTFSITVNDAGTAVQVVQGALEVQTVDGGAKELIRPGMIARIMATDQFRLKIEGDHPHIVTSPNAPAKQQEREADITVSSAEPSALTDSVTGSENTVITTKIAEGDVSIAKVTGGLIEGNASFAANVTSTTQAVSTIKAAEVELASLPPTPAPTPADVVAAADPVLAVSGTSGTSGGVTPVAAAPATVASSATTPPTVAAATSAPVVPAATAAVATAPAVAPAPTVVAAAPATVATTAPATVLTSCAGVPNCNGSTYTGPSNVANGSSCAGVANCNGGAFNVNGNAGGAATPTTSTVATSTATPAAPAASVTTAPTVAAATTTPVAPAGVPSVVATPTVAAVATPATAPATVAAPVAVVSPTVVASTNGNSNSNSGSSNGGSSNSGSSNSGSSNSGSSNGGSSNSGSSNSGNGNNGNGSGNVNSSTAALTIAALKPPK
jgi:FecR protein